MKPKEKAISKLNKEYQKEAWRELDRYEMDFHKFLLEEVVPHLSIEGIKILTDEFKRWNKEGEENIKYKNLY